MILIFWLLKLRNVYLITVWTDSAGVSGVELSAESAALLDFTELYTFGLLFICSASLSELS